MTTADDGDVNPPTNPPPLTQAIRSKYEQWLAPYRGLVPHGIRNPAPTDSAYDEPELIEDSDYEITLADQKPPQSKTFVAVPVIITDDRTGINRSTDVYHTGFQESVGAFPKLIVGRDVTRTMIRLSNNGPGTVYISHNESVGLTGYPLEINEAFDGHGTRDYWAVQQSGQPNPAVLGIYTEYEREIE